MQLEVSAAARTELERARRGARGVRQWRRYQAVLLLADGRRPAAVAEVLGVAPASVYNWAAAWRRAGLAGLAEGLHLGMARRFDQAAERWLDGLLASDPHERGHAAGGWTVPLLLGEARRAGYAVGARTLRRAIHRLGWRWKRPTHVPGRPDPSTKFRWLLT